MHIFISYARRGGSDFANSVIREIEKHGFTHWIDNEKIGLGKDWRQKIDEAIRESFALILIITPEAIISEYVTYEWIFALGTGVAVFPLVFIDVLDEIARQHGSIQIGKCGCPVVSDRPSVWVALGRSANRICGDAKRWRTHGMSRQCEQQNSRKQHEHGQHSAPPRG